MKFFILIFVIAFGFTSFGIDKPKEIHDVNIYHDGPSRDERAYTTISEFLRFMNWDNDTEHQSGRNMRALVNLLYRNRDPRTWIGQVVEYAQTDEYMNKNPSQKKVMIERAQAEFGMYLNRYVLRYSLCERLFTPGI